jgi:hypothetical protein
MGSPAVAAFIAHVVFWTLIGYGRATGALETRPAAVVIALWTAGAIGFPYLPYQPARAMFSSCVAALDIALVFLIFKGDVPLA